MNTRWTHKCYQWSWPLKWTKAMEITNTYCMYWKKSESKRPLRIRKRALNELQVWIWSCWRIRSWRVRKAYYFICFVLFCKISTLPCDKHICFFAFWEINLKFCTTNEIKTSTFGFDFPHFFFCSTLWRNQKARFVATAAAFHLTINYEILICKYH